jgi:hypothetical protein
LHLCLNGRNRQIGFDLEYKLGRLEPCDNIGNLDILEMSRWRSMDFHSINQGRSVFPVLAQS